MSARNPLEALTSRRRFLRDAAVTAAVAGVATACKPEGTDAQAAATRQGQPTGGTMGPHDTTSAAAAMDEAHEKGVKGFPARTAGKGNQLLAPRMDGNVKVYELTAKKIRWEVEPGRMIEAWAYNEQIPGPQIRVREGDRVRIILDNQLDESTATH